MRVFIKVLLQALAIGVAAYLVPGVFVDSLWTAVVVAVVLGVLNVFVKPLLLLLTLPISIATLGLFAVFINVLMILLASELIPGFEVSSFLSAVIFGLVLGLVNWLLSSLK